MCHTWTRVGTKFEPKFRNTWMNWLKQKLFFHFSIDLIFNFTPKLRDVLIHIDWVCLCVCVWHSPLITMSLSTNTWCCTCSSPSGCDCGSPSYSNDFNWNRMSERFGNNCTPANFFYLIWSNRINRIDGCGQSVDHVNCQQISIHSCLVARSRSLLTM